MKHLKIFLIIVSLISCNVYGQEVHVLTQGQPAPFSGVLFPNKKANEIRKQLIQGDGYKLINESLEKSITLYKDNEKLQNEKINLLLTENINLNNRVDSLKKSNDLERVIWFSLGVLATGFALYGAKKATQ